MGDFSKEVANTLHVVRHKNTQKKKLKQNVEPFF